MENKEKKVIKINTRVPRVPQWLKLDHTMKLRLPVGKAKELAQRLLEMEDDVDVQLHFTGGERGSVNLRYEPMNAGAQADEGEKSGWGAGGQAAMGAQSATGGKESGWQPGVQSRNARIGEVKSGRRPTESGTEETSRDAEAESREAARARMGEGSQMGGEEEEMEEGDISTVMSVECTPYNEEEERQPG